MPLCRGGCKRELQELYPCVCGQHCNWVWLLRAAGGRSSHSKPSLKWCKDCWRGEFDVYTKEDFANQLTATCLLQYFGGENLEPADTTLVPSPVAARIDHGATSTSNAEEMRRARDGEAYSWSEFRARYGDEAQSHWSEATPVTHDVGELTTSTASSWDC